MDLDCILVCGNLDRRQNYYLVEVAALLKSDFRENNLCLTIPYLIP